MTKRNKQALYILGISIPSLGLGVWGFEIGGGGGAVGLITAIGITFGVTGSISGLTMLFTKNRLGWFDSEPFDFKPIFIKKEKTEMPKIKKEEPVKKDGSESESIGLMKREVELQKRSQELNTLIVEADAELNQVRDDLQTKGWIQTADGWIIG